MSRFLFVLLTVSLWPWMLPAEDPPPVPVVDPGVFGFESLRAQAVHAGETHEGKTYEKRFTQVVAEPLQAALVECTKGLPRPFPVVLVFVIDRNGVARRIVTPPNRPISERVAEALGGIRLPSPPHDDWPVLVNINVTD